MEEDIENLMLKFHRKINEQLFRLYEIVETNRPITNQEFLTIFNNFSNEVKNHFHVEEETIFELYDKFSNEQEISDTFDLMQEHGEIIGMIKHIQKNAQHNQNHVKENLSKLKEKLIHHVNFENNHFYPELDNKLTETEKQEVIKVIKNHLKND